MEEKIAKVLSILNERQRRLYLALEAEEIGHGGIVQVAKASGVSRATIIQGKRELAELNKVDGGGLMDQILSAGYIRKEGGGRKSIEQSDPEVIGQLEALLEPLTRGHPESVLKWTCLSTRTLAAALQKKGFSISHTKVGELLKESGYSLQANAKKIEGGNHPDRNEQFMYINDKTEQYLANGFPAISVDTKKKELIGNFKNAGKEYRPLHDPRPVKVHDFGKQKAAPYGVYDIGSNEGFVNVGISSDTAEFAVHSIKQWWAKMGKKQYEGASKLLITADAGGSNGYRTKLWKTELQQLADELGMEITVCHFPPGTSKWNKIEHSLFCFISMNWKGIPLVDYQTVVQLIAAVKTTQGLKVKARLDLNEYEKGKVVTSQEMENLNMKGHKFHPEWNYTFTPN